VEAESPPYKMLSSLVAQWNFATKLADTPCICRMTGGCGPGKPVIFRSRQPIWPCNRLDRAGTEMSLAFSRKGSSKAQSSDGMSKVFVFPGQGSQVVGMGKALSEAFAPARAVFEEVDSALNQKLTELMFSGPESELTLTANAQPALMAFSLAVLRVLEAEAGLDLARDAAFVAGHSLGEYSALAAAGSFSVSDAAVLLRRRGEAMQRAVPAGQGAMAALLGLDLETGVAVTLQAQTETGNGAVCQIANDNGGGQVVASGTREAVERAIEIAKTKGAKRSILLPVSAPFHCALMQPAAEVMQAALADVEIKPPKVPLVANVIAQPVAEPSEIRRLLVAQVTGTVRWRESVLAMTADGASIFIELGAGKVLTGLLKRIAESARGLAVGAPADVETYKTLA
jgi:[acyl-carrier-protein] S-malonyltransferase